jgi:hypothetical protein
MSGLATLVWCCDRTAGSPVGARDAARDRPLREEVRRGEVELDPQVCVRSPISRSSRTHTEG